MLNIFVLRQTNEVERKELTISCNSVLKIIQNLESKTDTQLQNSISYQTDRLNYKCLTKSKY